ncbi:VOC family protein [Pseudarthrobacter sp. SSS035]|uniref:VOC family protein n=1 Tax=Pseudarthrobacter sp. SSS035 TaxID=2931399 RepID=UPI00200C8D87|nr:VOC family protein [Pseudarthrobacter sp. SSS035]
MTNEFTLRGVMLPVEDLDTALHFYSDTLGWTLRFRDGDRYASLDAGVTTIALAAPVEQPVEGRPALPVKVRDVARAVAALSDAGVDILLAPVNGPDEVRAAVRDTAGNIISLYAPLEAAAVSGGLDV